jgi:hypothetical protein
MKKAYEGDLAVSVGVFFWNSSFSPSKGSHEKEAGSILMESGGRDVMFIE